MDKEVEGGKQAPLPPLAPPSHRIAGGGSTTRHRVPRTLWPLCPRPPHQPVVSEDTGQEVVPVECTCRGPSPRQCTPPHHHRKQTVAHGSSRHPVGVGAHQQHHPWCPQPTLCKGSRGEQAPVAARALPSPGSPHGPWPLLLPRGNHTRLSTDHSMSPTVSWPRMSGNQKNQIDPVDPGGHHSSRQAGNQSLSEWLCCPLVGTSGSATTSAA